MKYRIRTLRTRVTAMLLALFCVIGLFPTAAYAAGTDTIKLERFGMSGVAYQSAALGKCSLHQMYYNYDGTTATGFCGEKGKGMGSSLIGQTWGNPREITDPTVKMFLAYYYAHSTGVFTSEAKALGVDTIWDAGYTWYMNAWVQAVVWRYQEGTLTDPVASAAEELMAVWNSLEGAHYTSIDQSSDGNTSFRDRVQYIVDLGDRGVWGDCTVREYSFTGSGSSAHPAGSVQKVIIGDLRVEETKDEYSLTIKKVDATNPTKSLPGAKFHVESQNGSYSKDVVTGSTGVVTLDNLTANTYLVTETEAPSGYKIDNAGPEYVVLPSNGSNSATITFTDTPEITASGSIRKVDADDPTHGLAGAVVKIAGVDNNFSGTYTSGQGGAFTGIPWDTMPIGSYVATEVTPPNGYTISSDPAKVRQEFYWDGKSEVSLIFENDSKVKIQLTKLNEVGKPLPGALFNILKDGQLIGTEAVDSRGILTVAGVTEGLYAFVESAAPEGYARLREPVIVYVDQAVIDGGGTVHVTAKDQRLPNLTILKRDGKDENTIIPGTVFEVKGIHYGYHQDVTTGPDGKAVLSAIPVDSYEVVEKSVPDPYVVGDEPMQTIWLGPGDAKELIFTNRKQPLLTVAKSDADDPTIKIPGTVFLVEGIDSDYKDEWTTGTDGTVSKRVFPGSYRITEKSVPAPYYISETESDRIKTISLNAGDERTVSFENHKRPSIEILKENSITHDPIPHVKMQVWYASNNTATGEYNDLGVFYTDSEGRIILTQPDISIRDGWFRVKELEPAPGFALPDEVTQEAFVPAGGSHTFLFEDRPLSAICVWKYDSVHPNVAIEGAVFQVKYLSGNTSGTGGTVIGTYRTSANGSFTVTGCKAGTYIIEELSSDGSHVIDTPPKTVYLSGQDQEVIQVPFGNSPKGAVLVKKVSDDEKKTPLSDVEFFVTDSTGAVVGDSNGKFVTDSSGSFLVENIDPNTTLIVKETRAKPGYLLDDTPQTATVKAGQTVSLEFRNKPLGNLIVEKWGRNGTTTVPLEGVKFEVKYANGQYVDASGGTLSSNGLYYTDSTGKITLSGITGTVVATELESVPGYTIDPNTQSQTVTINPNDTQTLRFYNNAVGGVEIIKVSEADKTKRLSGAVFEIRRVSDDALVDTVTTGKTGSVFVTLEDNSYYAVETESPDGFKLDSAPHYFTVKNGKCPPLTVTNTPISGILLHKISSLDGKGIYGVPFILYDSSNTPIDQQTSDDRGYVRFENLKAGRYYLRELENEGYIPDTQKKTVYVKAGEMTEVEWKNTPITAQIQIIKKSADYNSTNGLPAGTLLEGAVFEVYDKANNVVDTIRSNSRGLAVSKPLPLSRYTIREVKAPANYGINETVLNAYLEHPGQIVTFEVVDPCISTGVNIKKTGPAEVMPGQPIKYALSGIGNTSTVPLQSFYWRDTLPGQVTLNKFVTGTYNQQSVYKVVYKTNLSGDSYRTLADNLSTTRNYVLEASPAALGLAANERVTEFMVVFGIVKAGFGQVETPYIYGTVAKGLSNGTSFVNTADVGGLHNGQWIMGVSRWVTRVYSKTVITLPRTGY